MQHSVNKHLDWHGSVWNGLLSAPAGLPHALLLCGPAGIGKGQLAMALGQRLLCENPADATASACGQCPSCHWFQTEQHPDFRRVIPEAHEETEGEGEAITSEKKKASQSILIDQIRALYDFVFVGSHRGNRRVVVIEPAEAMNIAAANALLKMLEEPPATVYFILISNRWKQLLPTIRSRCRLIMLPRPDRDQASRWLDQQGNKQAADLLPVFAYAPAQALDEAGRDRLRMYKELTSALGDPGDPLALADRWEAQLKRKDDPLRMDELVTLIQKWVHDLAVAQTSGDVRFFPASAREIAALGAKASRDGVLRFHEELFKIRGLANHPLNPRLVLEDLAVRYLRALAPVPR